MQATPGKGTFPNEYLIREKKTNPPQLTYMSYRQKPSQFEKYGGEIIKGIFGDFYHNKKKKGLEITGTTRSKIKRSEQDNKLKMK